MNWKKILLVSFGWGLGTAVGLAGIVGCFIWYQDRPKPPKPWNTIAISSSGEGPGFSASSDGKTISLTYVLQNATEVDYEIGPETEIKITFKNADGSLSEPMPKEFATLRRPVFIPARQKAFSNLSVAIGDVPRRQVAETDEQYHERLRAFCRKEMGDAGFVVFDERNRYQINLPKILAQKPQKPS